MEEGLQKTCVLPSSSRIPLGVITTSHIRPLTQRSLAHQQCTRLTKTGRDESIAGNHAAEEGPGRGLRRWRGNLGLVAGLRGNYIVSSGKL